MISLEFSYMDDLIIPATEDTGQLLKRSDMKKQHWFTHYPLANVYIIVAKP